MNIEIVRAFIVFIKTLPNIDELKNILETLRNRYSSQFVDVFDAIQFLMTDNKEIETRNERIRIGYKK